jgi:hypothetical protein
MEWKYLLKRMKNKFELEDEDIELANLNYAVGNTSGMDVTGDIPSALAERVGRTAQRGGSEMEIQVENPSSYHLDREPLYNVLEGLGLDVSFHSDPNVGYTSAYRTGQGRGYQPTHQYFTSYLQEFASFKEEKEARGLSFNISRINPHISTDEVPALEERMAQDVSVDPFGVPTADFSRETVNRRNKLKSNFYTNKNFLEDLYFTLYLRESNYAFEQFQAFAGYSTDFDKIWKYVRHKAAKDVLDQELPSVSVDERVREYIVMAQTISMTDRAIGQSWREVVSETELKPALEFEQGMAQQILDEAGVDSPEDLNEEHRRAYDLIEEREGSSLNHLSEVNQILPGERVSVSEITNLDAVIRTLEEKPEIFRWVENSEPVDIIKEAVEDAFEELWRPVESHKDVGDSYISIEGKMQGLQRRLDVQQLRIMELAYKIGREEKFSVNGFDLNIDGAAAKVMAGFPEFYTNRDDKGPEELHRDLLNRVLESQRLERLLRMESVIFYQLLPTWMRNSNSPWEFRGEKVHKAYEAPEFIWDVIVESRWDYQIRNPTGDDWYFNMLADNQDFQRDVAAASAALYVWGHFTQKESEFQMDGNENVEKDYDRCTWIEWMNRYGIGVNMEAMQGSPQQEFKLWKPRHMVVAAHAVNLTARKQLDEINEKLYDSPMKFTIDMEHTSSFGVDPWREMEDLIKIEETLADRKDEEDWNIRVDGERPLSEMVRMYHLTKPGQETTQGTGHLHGPFRFGDKQLYTWLHDMVQNGFAQSDERASVMYEIGGDQSGTVQKAKLSMNMIELGISPKELDPSRVDPGKKYENEKEALIARFFRMDRPHYSREWAKIEEHAFDPLKGLLEATEFEYTFTSSAALDRGKQREFPDEEYR